MANQHFEDIRSSISIKDKALDALHDADEEIVRTKWDVGRIQAFILHLIMATTGATTGAFFVYDQWTDRLMPICTNGYPVGIEFSPQSIDEGIIGAAARERRPVIVSDLPSHEWKRIYRIIAPTTKSVLAFPICDKESESHHVIALISLEHSEAGFFRQEHVELLEMFAVKVLIGLNYGGLLERNKRSIRALEILGVIAARSQSGAHDRNTIIWLFLTGVTAYEGLGFSRAMVFLKSEQEDALEGAIGIGELDANKARIAWETEDTNKTGRDVLHSHLERVERMSAAIRAGTEEAPPITRAIKTQKIFLDNYESALVHCLYEGRYQIVKHDEYDQFRDTLAVMSGGADRGAAFICVPIALRERVMGVIVADNRWLSSEREATFDASSLVTYGNILAISLDNERLRKSAAFSTVFSEIGHDFNRQISRLLSVISSLRYEIHKSPHIESIFWNSVAGDYFEKLLAVRDDIARFAMDFQEFGKRISLNYRTVELGEFVQERVEEARWEMPFRIEYDICPQKHVLELDAELIGRAIDAILNNAQHALTNTEVSDDPHIAVVSSFETDPAGHSFAVISIADNGPGVPVERKQKIFQPFFTTRAAEGSSGLGLASARRYVEAHGGSLREVGIAGEGARFVIRLPLPTRHIVQNSADGPS